MTELPRIGFLGFPLLILAVALALGILMESQLNVQSTSLLILLAFVSVTLSVVALWLRRKVKLLAASVSIIIAFVSAGFSLEMVEQPPAPNRLSQMITLGTIIPNEPVEVTGVIEGQPEPAPQSFYLRLHVDQVQFQGTVRPASGTLLLFARVIDQQVNDEYNALELRHGARVRVMTNLDREDDFRNPGVMPFTEYLERKGFDATGVIKSPLLIERLDDERVFLPMAWLYEWRAWLEKEFNTRFKDETAGVLNAALLGNRYGVSHAAADRFRAGGTFHILVIAGLHIGFIGGVAFVFARLLTRRRLVQFLLSASFLWGYAIAVGAQPPVIRAALMFTLVVFAPLAWRRANSLNVIGGAALALLIARPNDLFDPSFQLTFASVLSIVTVAAPMLGKMQQVGAWRPTMNSPYPPESPRWFRALSEALYWSEQAWRLEMAGSNISYRLFKHPLAAALERWHLQKPLRYATAAIALSASVQIGMLPLLVLYFHRLSFASILLNIFVGAMMVVLAALAFAAIAMAHVNSFLSVFLIGIAERLSWLMIHLVDPFMRLGIASIRLPTYSGWMRCIYVLYYIPLGFLILYLASWIPLLPSRIVSVKSFRRRIQYLVIAFVLLAGLIVFHPFSAPRPDGKLHVDFVDVGQGDSALLTMPDGTTLLVDGGGRPNIDWNSAADLDAEETFQRDTRSIGEGVVSEYLWSRGIDRIDYILATHAHSDHMDGLNDIARNFSVRGALIARAPIDDPEYARFAETMTQAGVPLQKIGAGDVLRFGAVSADVLWPPASDDLKAPSANNDSVFLRLRFGEKVLLLTGDIEKEAEAAVLKAGIDLHSDVVKVPHHGSRTSSTEAFVAASKPQLAIISVGRTSVFGHPHQDVVERWRQTGAEVMTTGKSGMISVETDGRSLSFTTFVR